MLQTNSIDFFKELIVEELPDYSILSDAQILEDCKLFLGIQSSESKCSEQIRTYINNLGGEKDEITEYLLSLIAQQFIQRKQEDEIIKLLLNNPSSNFDEILKQINHIASGIHKLENAQRKKILQDLETKLESEELEVVLQRVERKENKKILESLEKERMFKNHKLASNDDISFSSDFYQPKSNESGLRSRSYLKIAAGVISFSIPTCILLFMVGIGTTHTAKNDNKNNKGHGQEYYASSMVDISLPKLNETSASKEINEYYSSQGFGSTDVNNIEINLIELEPQLKYVIQKRKLVTDYINKINKKAFKHKVTTLDSLNTAMKELYKLEEILIHRDNVYEFTGNEVKLYFIKSKDLQKLKVFNYNEREKETYYLYIDGIFFELRQGKGKLIPLTDEDRKAALEELRMNTP